MRFIFDTSVLIDYLRGNEMAANALFLATEKGSVFISIVSFMELWLPRTISNENIRAELLAIRDLCQKLNIRIVPCSPRAQGQALILIEKYRSPLGRNAQPDSLIMATGMTRRAYLVTKDSDWFNIAQDIPRLRVLSPEKLMEMFG